MPRASMQPLSPECSQPSLSMASAVFFSISATCSLPRSGFAMYPIIICRPRKHTSPCSASVGASSDTATSASTFVPSSLGLKILTSMPAIVQPQLPHTCEASQLHVVAPVHSDMP